MHRVGGVPHAAHQHHPLRRAQHLHLHHVGHRAGVCVGTGSARSPRHPTRLLPTPSPLTYGSVQPLGLVPRQRDGPAGHQGHRGGPVRWCGHHVCMGEVGRGVSPPLNFPVVPSPATPAPCCGDAEPHLSPTRDVEVRVACGLPHFVGNDAFVDTSVRVADGREHQAMDVLVWGDRGKSPSAARCRAPLPEPPVPRGGRGALHCIILRSSVLSMRVPLWNQVMEG